MRSNRWAASCLIAFACGMAAAGACASGGVNAVAFIVTLVMGCIIFVAEGMTVRK